MPNAVLVTGAAGFVGSHLVDLLVRERVPVCAWYRPGGRRPRSEGGGGVEWRATDLLDRSGMAAAVADLSPSAIFHCAGAAHVGASFDRTAPTFQANVLGTHYLLDAVRRAGLDARVLVPGSALVYRPSATPLGEDEPVAPASPYALSKLAQEMLAARYHRDEGIRVLLPRSFNHVGPRQNPSYSASGFARQIALIEQGRLEPVLHVGNLKARRDLTDVRDTVRAYRALMERGEPGRLYNVCSGQAYAIADVLDALLARTRVHVRVEQDPARLRPHDLSLVVGDNSRIARELGWTPVIPLERTLEDLLEYWREAVRQDGVAAASHNS